MSSRISRVAGIWCLSAGFRLVAGRISVAAVRIPYSGCVMQCGDDLCCFGFLAPASLYCRRRGCESGSAAILTAALCRALPILRCMGSVAACAMSIQGVVRGRTNAAGDGQGFSSGHG